MPLEKILKLFPTLVLSAKFPLTRTSSRPHFPFLMSSTLVRVAPLSPMFPVPAKLRMFSPTMAKTVQVADWTSQSLEKASLSWFPFHRTLNDDASRGNPYLAAQSNLSLNLRPSLAVCWERVIELIRITNKAKSTIFDIQKISLITLFTDQQSHPPQQLIFGLSFQLKRFSLRGFDEVSRL